MGKTRVALLWLAKKTQVCYSQTKPDVEDREFPIRLQRKRKVKLQSQLYRISKDKRLKMTKNCISDT